MDSYDKTLKSITCWNIFKCDGFGKYNEHIAIEEAELKEIYTSLKSNKNVHHKDIDLVFTHYVNMLGEEFEYKDNFRLANTRNKEDMVKYKQQESDGCCGFYDITIKSADTKITYLLGCNYGH